MKIALLPLDSRSCNRLFPVRLADACGIELTTPALEVLDNFTIPALVESIENWVREQASAADLLVLSVDMLLYGGLLSSRTGTPDIDECKRRLQIVRDIKNENPTLQIHAFNVIMRTSISILSEQNKTWWEKINELSRLTYKVEMEKNAQDSMELEKLIQELPAEVLDTFFRARERNHKMNSACIDLVRDGVLEQLVLLQEDSYPYGIHKKEQKLLQQKINAAQLNQRVQIHNGADEAGCLLVAHGINRLLKQPISICFQYLCDNRESFVARYEDRLFHDNLLSHARTCGATLNENFESSDIVLFIHTPKGEQYDACLYEGELPHDFSEEEVDDFAQRIASAVRSGKKVGLLDIAYANGGDGKLLTAIAQIISLLDLYGYAAWNTASNSLGTVLAQLSLSPNTCAEENRKFTAERLLDDYLYQSVVRRKLERALREQGLDIYNLKAARGMAERLLNQYLNDSPAMDWLFSGRHISFSCHLPWPRTFECAIAVNSVNCSERGS